MDAGVLTQVLRELPPITDPNVLVGSATADDAAVYRISDDLALVQTVDFFTPIVDDPRDFGRISAANALSDVYAMGGRPITALAIAAFPEDLDLAIAGAILQGGAEKAAEAGIAIVGGHTIKDPEPKYGLSVTGLIDPRTIRRNDTGRAGDVLILTKAIGTGILTTARRRDAIADADLAPAVASMLQLNRTAAETLAPFEPSAMTDVTGFGLIGHLAEMAASGLGAVVDASAVPLLPRTVELAAAGIVPGGSRTNLRIALERGTRFDATLGEALQLALCDAQTSGGLLAAVAPERADAALRALHAAGIAAAHAIGRLTTAGAISVR